MLLFRSEQSILLYWQDTLFTRHTFPEFMQRERQSFSLHLFPGPV